MIEQGMFFAMNILMLAIIVGLVFIGMIFLVVGGYSYYPYTLKETILLFGTVVAVIMFTAYIGNKFSPYETWCNCWR